MTVIGRAIDIGFGTVSTCVECINNLPTIATIPSIVARKHSEDDAIAVAQYRSGNTLLNIDGQVVEVGPDMSLTSGPQVCRDLSRTYVDSLQYRALFLAGLNMMKLPNNRIDVLVGGLPVERMSERQQLQDFMTGRHAIGARTVEVAKAIVIAQPLAGLLCYAQQDGVSNYQKVMHSQCLLGIDPGYLTFDWCVLNRGKPVDDMSGSNEYGLSKIIDAVESVLKDAFKVTAVPSVVIEDALAHGELRMFGTTYPFPVCTGADRTNQETDIRFNAQTAIDSICDMAVTDLKSQIGLGAGIDRIPLMGGPSKWYMNAIQRAYPRHQITRLNNPLQSVAIGMQILANSEASKLMRAAS